LGFLPFSPFIKASTKPEEHYSGNNIPSSSPSNSHSLWLLLPE
jgi:hypothetical protein